MIAEIKKHIVRADDEEQELYEICVVDSDTGEIVDKIFVDAIIMHDDKGASIWKYANNVLRKIVL